MGRFEFNDVFFNGPRILIQILFIIELDRIYKDAGYRNVIFSLRPFQQRGVAAVQSTHSWNKPNRFSLFFEFKQTISCLFYRRKYFQIKGRIILEFSVIFIYIKNQNYFKYLFMYRIFITIFDLLK